MKIEQVRAATENLLEKDEMYKEKLAKSERNLESYNEDVETARSSARKATNSDGPRVGCPETLSKATAALKAFEHRVQQEMKKHENVDTELVNQEWIAAAKLLANERTRHNDVKRNFELLQKEKKVRGLLPLPAPAPSFFHPPLTTTPPFPISRSGRIE